MDKPGLSTNDAGLTHCSWRTAAPEYPHYHDHEWGVPVADDIQLYEKICLEGFQAGMAWITILRKREHFRRAFDGFDFRRVAQYGEADIERLMARPWHCAQPRERSSRPSTMRAGRASWWRKAVRWRNGYGRSNRRQTSARRGWIWRIGAPTRRHRLRCACRRP